MKSSTLIKTTGAKIRIKGDTVTKRYYCGNKHLYENEIYWLKILPRTPFFPNLLECSDDELSITTKYSGEPISTNNAPSNWEEQIKKILSALEMENCHHSDLLPQNILVNDGQLNIIDFAYAQKLSETSSPRKPRLFSDAYTKSRILSLLNGFPENSEVHIFTVWDVKNADIVERELGKRIKIIDKITFSSQLYVEYFADRYTWLEKFYSSSKPLGSRKGSKPFCSFIVLSTNPSYQFRKRVFDAGKSIVNTEIFDLKMRIRAGRRNYLHASDNMEEARRNLKYLSHNEQSVPFAYTELSRPNFRSVSEIFQTLNKLPEIRYVLLRTPAGRSEDYDILCDDYFAVKRALGGVAYKTYSNLMFRTVGAPVDESGFKVAQYVKLNDKKIRFDIRYVGDGYYPRNWQQNMLQNRILRDGIYVCSEEDEFFGKAYHALFHKSSIPKKYNDYFCQKLSLNAEMLEQELRRITSEFITRHNYFITRPKDLTIPFNPTNLKLYATRREFYFVKREVLKENYSGASKILQNHYLIKRRDHKIRFYYWLAYILFERTAVRLKFKVKRLKRRIQFMLDRSFNRTITNYVKRSV